MSTHPASRPRSNQLSHLLMGLHPDRCMQAPLLNQSGNYDELLRKLAHEDGLMVRNPVAQPTDTLQSIMQIFPLLGQCQ